MTRAASKPAADAKSAKANTYRQYVPMPADSIITPEMRDGIMRDAITKLHCEVAKNAMRVATEIECVSRFEYDVPRADENDETSGGWVAEDLLAPSDREGLDRREVISMSAVCEPVDTVAVLADGVSEATEYAEDRWHGKNVRVIALTDRVSLARLYGHQRVPFSIAPGTTKLMWHREIAHHTRAGRLVLIDE